MKEDVIPARRCRLAAVLAVALLVGACSADAGGQAVDGGDDVPTAADRDATASAAGDAASEQRDTAPGPLVGELVGEVFDARGDPDAHATAESGGDAPGGDGHAPTDPGDSPGVDGEPTGGEAPAAMLHVAVDAPEGWHRINVAELLEEAGASADDHVARDADLYVNEDACDGGFCAYLHVTVLDGVADDLAVYHQRTREETEQAVGAPLRVDRDATLGGHPARHVEYDSADPSPSDDPGHELGHVQRYAIVERRVVVVTFTATQPLLEAWRSDAEAMLDSVAVTTES